jgi:acetyl-CoA/propionyl-CoA carboxylase, biotin carboxylase, biotin carboxyl carrier protein
MYDPMVAKLIVWDVDREQATNRMLRALGEYVIEDLKTLIPFHQAIMATGQWANAETCRDLIEDREWLKQLAFPKPAPKEDDDGEPVEELTYQVEVSGKRFDVKVRGKAVAPVAAGPAANGAAAAPKPKRSERSGGGGGGPDLLESPLQGNMWKVLVEQGQTVEEGQLLCIIEAMKMENEITAHKAGTLEELLVKEGEPIQAGAPIARIATAE